MDPKSKADMGEEAERAKHSFKVLSMTTLELLPKLFSLKSKTFCEEQEWRLLSYLVKPDDDCLFRSEGSRIMPYRKFKLLDLKGNAINEIILGPNNLTPIYVIENF